MKNIPVIIMCGGTGTRLREQTEFIPKPMVPIGGVPMVVHIMKWYAKFGFRKFVLALGYKQEIFKQYFASYGIINSDVSINLKYGEITRPICCDMDWDVVLADTGLDTLKEGRLKRVAKYVDADTFMLTYGDGVGDVDLNALLACHNKNGRMVTVTGVHPKPKFGEIKCDGECVIDFSEKPERDGYLINGGFFVMDRGVFGVLRDDGKTDLERDTLVEIADNHQIAVYRHTGYWQNMDTINDMMELEKIWKEGNAPWKV